MRNKILIAFIVVAIVNFIFASLLFRYNGDDLGIKNTIILLIGSYIVYFFLNLYLFCLKETKQEVNFDLVCIIGGVAGFIALLGFVMNLRNDKIYFFPMMYVISMLCSFFIWKK